MTVPADSTAPVQSPTPAGFVMRVHGGQHDGRLIQVNADKCTIGRARDCTVCLSSAEFEPLHCLIVRGRGGVVARCWSQGATKLNGQDFTVSWMAPGDRLGVGPIELELLEGASSWQSADSPSLEAALPTATDNGGGEPRKASLPSKPATDQLTETQQLLDQLLEERQDLLEHVGSLELELQETKEERDHLNAVVKELREELAAVAEQRRQWQQELDELQRQLEAARELGAGNGNEVDSPARSVADLDLPESVEDVEEGQARFSSSPVMEEDDDEALDIKAVLARYGVVIREDGGESFAAQESSAAAKPADAGARDAARTASPSASSGAAGSAETPAPEPTKPAKKRSASMPRVNLSALRDVANLTARVNIDRAIRRQKLQQAGFKWSMGVCAIIIGWFVTVLLPYDPVLAHVLSFACWAIAVWWLFLGSIYYHRAVLKRTSTASEAPDGKS